MQFGAPTICSNSSSLPEVAGVAAIQLNPLNSDDWANAMIALSKNPDKRQELQLAGYEQAKKFNALDNARIVLDLYQEVLTVPKRI